MKKQRQQRPRLDESKAPSTTPVASSTVMFVKPRVQLPLGVQGEEVEGGHRFSVYFRGSTTAARRPSASPTSASAAVRCGIGKGESIDEISGQDVLDPFTNVNSYPRESLGWRSPFRAFKAAFPESGGLFEALGFGETPAAQVKFKEK